MNPTPISNASPAIISKMIDQRLAELPEVKAAMDAANANAEAQAAAARQIVLDELAQVEPELGDLAGIGDSLDTAIAELRRQLADLGYRRAQHAVQIQRIGARARVLTQRLNTDHGGGMINAVLNHLRAQAQNLRDGADRQRRLKRGVRDVWGAIKEMEDHEAQAKAVEMEDKAGRIDSAINDIDYLSREPISPQEIGRRIATAVAPLGMTFNLEDQPAGDAWRIERWSQRKTGTGPV